MIIDFKFSLKYKFFLFPIILLFIVFNNFPLLKLHSSQGDNDKKISIEYLDNLPVNDYIVGPGDSLDIIISRELNLFSEVTVDGEGTIYLPRLERVYVNGLTINELNSILNKAYLKFIKFPTVETIVTEYRPIRVFVNGEVINPGLITLDGSLSIKSKNAENNNLNIFSNQESRRNNTSYYFPSVFDAIRASGGITKFSNLKNVQVIRKNSVSNGSGKITTTLNFEDLLVAGENSQNIRIYDSDIIIVKKSDEPNLNLLTKAILSNLNPKFIEVFVTGRVNRPGRQKISRASVLSDAIDMAGGAKILRGPVTFIRFESDGSIDKRKMSLTKRQRGKFRNPNLRDGDLILVGDNVLTTTNEVITEFTSPFVGIFSTYGLIKAITD